MYPMNTNPLMMLVQAMQAGGNPMAMMQQMAGQNPRMAQALQMMQGKNAAQLQQMAYNMARERGMDVGAIARSLGVNLPK